MLACACATWHRQVRQGALEFRAHAEAEFLSVFMEIRFDPAAGTRFAKLQRMVAFSAKLSGAFILSLLVLVTGTACDGTGGTEPPRSCRVGDQLYESGASFASDCNTCNCLDGDITCTRAACEDPGGDGDGDSGGDGDGDMSPGGNGGDGDGDGDGGSTEPLRSCQVGNQVYESGESFASDCNTCSCFDGDVTCTRAACVDPICELPFDGGDCDGSFSVYWHNPETGLCEPTIYGGCGGNENRFSIREECARACGAPSGSSCEVDDVVYPDGATNVPEPGGCNTCTCNDGVVASCTKIGCPSLCPEGTELGSYCSECAPNDACLTMRTGCLLKCEEREDCASPGAVCLDGLCKHFCA